MRQAGLPLLKLICNFTVCYLIFIGRLLLKQRTLNSSLEEALPHILEEKIRDSSTLGQLLLPGRISKQCKKSDPTCIQKEVYNISNGIVFHPNFTVFLSLQHNDLDFQSRSQVSFCFEQYKHGLLRNRPLRICRARVFPKDLKFLH